MMQIGKAAPWVLGMCLVLGLSSCGIVTYPGQPGLVTNGYSKIDLELMDKNGVWVYETNYDNRQGGKGLGAVVTKLYPGATQFTSNTRADKSAVVYREKGAYHGAVVQAISIPSLNQVMVPPDSKIQAFLSYGTSLNEVDDRNLAEEAIFSAPPGMLGLSPAAMRDRLFRWDLLKAGTLRSDGTIEYQITRVELGGKKFTPNTPVKLVTTLRLNSVQVQLDAHMQQEFTHFIEENFATGYRGIASLSVSGASRPVELSLGVHTLKTAERAGIQFIHNASRELIAQTLARFQH